MLSAALDTPAADFPCQLTMPVCSRACQSLASHERSGSCQDAPIVTQSHGVKSALATHFPLHSCVKGGHSAAVSLDDPLRLRLCSMWQCCRCNPVLRAVFAPLRSKPTLPLIESPVRIRQLHYAPAKIDADATALLGMRCLAGTRMIPYDTTPSLPCGHLGTMHCRVGCMQATPTAWHNTKPALHCFAATWVQCIVEWYACKSNWPIAYACYNTKPAFRCFAAT
jgi:hypothetical protein